MADHSFVLAHIRETISRCLHQPPAPAETLSDRVFAEQFETAVRAVLSDDEWAVFSNILNRQNEALTAAQAGRLEAASKGFRILRAEQHNRSGSPALTALADIFIGAAEAYLRYRLADYEEAERLIRRATALDQDIIDSHGLTLMSAHRLQLGHNLVRIRARQGRHREAVRLVADFMAYLEWHSVSLPRELASPRKQLSSVPECIPQHYFDRLCSEAAMLLAGRFDDDARMLFGFLAPHAHKASCSSSGYGQDAHVWLRLKTLALAGEECAFLEQSAQTIEAGRKNEPLFWFAAVMDLIGFCRHQSEEGAELANWLNRETQQMGGVPYPLRKMLAAE